MLASGSVSVRQHLIGLATAVLLLLGGFSAVRRYPVLFDYWDAGYPDSYILHTARRFLNTGTIYHELGTDPMVPAIYGPATYLTFAAAWKLPAVGIPFFWPRVLPLLALLASAFVCASTARVLYRNRWAPWWAFALTLYSCSPGTFVWQTRGDFFACLLSLSAIRLLLAGSAGAAAVAGICAGLAPLYKLSYVSAMAAGAIVLLLRRSRLLIPFLSAAVAVFVSTHLLTLLAQPFFVDHHRLFFGIMSSTLDGWRAIVKPALLSPAAISCAIVVVMFPAASLRGGGLLAAYGLISLLVAAVASTQVGANVNYFFEPLMAMAAIGSALPVVFGFLFVRRRRLPALRLVSAGVFAFTLLYVLVPLVRAMETIRTPKPEHRAAACLETLHQTSAVLSFVPRLSLFDDSAPLTEPFFVEAAAQKGHPLRRQLQARILAAEFDVVLLPVSIPETRYRGIMHVHETTLECIRSRYEPFAVTPAAAIHVRRDDARVKSLVREWLEKRCPDSVTTSR